MASAQVVETSVNINNSPSQDYTTNPDDHPNHNIDSPGFKPFTVIPLLKYPVLPLLPPLPSPFPPLFISNFGLGTYLREGCGFIETPGVRIFTDL